MGKDTKAEVIADLIAEGNQLASVITGLDPAAWSTPTSPGWTIAHTVAHLAFTDELGLTALTDESAFNALRQEHDPNEPDDPTIAGFDASADQLLARWTRGRTGIADALAAASPEQRVPWVGPSMSITSFASARLMETWAHGVDIVEALGAEPPPTGRLRHIAHLGVRTRDFSFLVHSEQPPSAPIRIDLDGVDDETWSWGPGNATQYVSGPALEFCLVVTRRRHPADTSLEVCGNDARRWLEVAQAFAGSPGPPPKRRRQRRKASSRAVPTKVEE